MNNEEDKEDNESSTSSTNSLSMESAGYYSPGSESKTPSLDHLPKAIATTTDGQSMKSENSCYSLDDMSSEVVKETLNVEPNWSTYKTEEKEEEDRGRTVEKLMKENGDLRDRLGEKENKYQNLENNSSTKMKELEDKVVALKLEIEELHHHERDKEMEIKEKSEQVANLTGKIVQSMDRAQNMQMEVDLLRVQTVEEQNKFLYEKENSKLQNEQLEMEFKNKTKEIVDECEKILMGKIVQSLDRVENIQIDVDALRILNVEARMRLYEKEKEVESLTVQNKESENEFKETLKEKAMNEEGLKQHVKDLAVMIGRVNVENENQKTTISQLNDEKEKHVHTISQLNDENEKQKSTISRINQENENQTAEISRLNDEHQKQQATISQLNDENEKQKTAISQLTGENEKQKTTISELNDEYQKQKTTISQLNDEKEKQKAIISQLEEKLRSKESQISTVDSKSVSVKKELTNKVKTLEAKCKNMEIDKKELEGKNDVLAGTLDNKDVLVDKLNDEAKANFRAAVKKMGEMMNEFRKASEDSTLILSRRIRVAETLHNETRDWYKKTRDKTLQAKIDTDMNVHTIKVLMTMVSETLKITETLGLRFVECCEDFMNRVSKVSCEINSAKDWVRRKNVANVQLKEDFDAVVIELDGKEEEILRSRKKVLKLDTKLRDLEKTVKENDNTIIILKEEKREAIRHLCVWTDYHRSRADFLTKSLSDLLAKNHRPVKFGQVSP